MLTMRPLAARRASRNACVTLKTPVRLIAMMSSQSPITASGAPVMPLRRGGRGVCCHRDAVFAFGDVEYKTFRLAAGIANLLCRFGRRLLVDVEQHHPRALAGITERDRAPDAGSCAGDDRDMVLQKRHRRGFL